MIADYENGWFAAVAVEVSFSGAFVYCELEFVLTYDCYLGLFYLGILAASVSFEILIWEEYGYVILTPKLASLFPFDAVS